jgi:hypothetical protein
MPPMGDMVSEFERFQIDAQQQHQQAEFERAYQQHHPHAHPHPIGMHRGGMPMPHGASSVCLVCPRYYTHDR